MICSDLFITFFLTCISTILSAIVVTEYGCLFVYKIIYVKLFVINLIFMCDNFSNLLMKNVPYFSCDKHDYKILNFYLSVFICWYI